MKTLLIIGAAILLAGCATTELSPWSSCVPPAELAKSSKAGELKKKLLAAKIPELEFRNAMLVDAFNFLTASSASSTKEQQDLVTFILLGKGTQKKKVSLSMRHTNVFDAFTTVCDMCSLNYIFDPRGIVFIIPKQPAQVEFHDEIETPKHKE